MNDGGHVTGTEHLGGDLGVTDPVSGEAVLEMHCERA